MTENQGSIPEREPEKRLPHLRKAAGTQLPHLRNAEGVTKSNDVSLFRGLTIGMTPTLNKWRRIYWRASLVPAAAVIPAPIAYI